MRNHVTLIVKATRLCNLRCSYCHDWRASGEMMSFEVLAKKTASALAQLRAELAIRKAAVESSKAELTRMENEPRPEELDPDLLIVWMARHVDRQRLPPNRTVVQFDFRDPKRRYWIVLEPA